MTGFADATASFTYSRSGRQLSLYFGIKSTDELLLKRLRSFFGVGRIYELKAAARYYRVTHREDLVRVVAHFDEFPLQSSKQQSFEIWREMVQLKAQFRQPNRAALDGLAARLSAGRS